MKSILQIHSPQWQQPVAVQLTAYFPDLREAISSYRKHILMAIGALVLVYALILQQIFHRLLSLPFFNMVTAAQRFADGNPESRFDESHKNEFGFLSKFINRALDSIAEQQKDLNDALTRATRSEAALFREKERAEVTLQSIAEAVITTNETGDVQYLNPIAERITGWTNEEAHGLPLSRVISIAQENSGTPLGNPVYECLKTNKVEKLAAHAALVRRDGETVAIEASAAPMRNDRGEVIGAVMACQDVSQARKLAYQLSYQAGHDALTGLYNRREFDTKLCELLENAKLSNNQHVLLYLDLDQFKVVNDTCGHAAGDKLLLQLSTLLSHKIRKNDILARLGGDEFAILLVSCDIDYGRRIAESLLDLISDFRFVWGEKIFQIGVSIGLVPVTAASESAAEVMSSADAACYVAKDEGRNRIQMFAGDEGRAKKYGEMQWVPRIHKAIEDERLVLCRQNIAALGWEDSMDHAEVLLRLEDEDGSIIPPMAFIPAAERYNIMPLLDRWVVKRALEWLKAHPTAASGRPQSLSINISGQSLGEELFLDFMLEQLTRSVVPPERICLEITETAAIANIGLAMEFINVLKKLGCTFALDDFGSGMSSYSYLKNLDVDFLKIDGSFVRDMATDPVDLAMVESIHRIGHVMGIRTIAEFVEDPVVLDELRNIGVDYVQGHIVHEPEPLWRPAATPRQEMLLQSAG
jgi:diguanylate cyclase (GGDEF)-like protein/PAS domain S-box-containing protein